MALSASLRAKRSNPESREDPLGCFVAEPVLGPRFARTRGLLAMTVGEAMFASLRLRGFPFLGPGHGPDAARATAVERRDRRHALWRGRDVLRADLQGEPGRQFRAGRVPAD